MIGKIKRLMAGEKMRYLFFGVLTTLVTFIVYFPLIRIFGSGFYMPATVIAWIIAVSFAFVTNKLFVFESKSRAVKVLAKELTSFFGARIVSLGIEAAGLYLFNELLGFEKFSFMALGFEVLGSDISKVIMTVAVIVLNYVFSKLIIFKKEAQG